MSTIDHDGYTIDSSNPDAAAVTSTLDATTPAPVEDRAAPSAEGPASGDAAPAEPEAVDATERERAPDGKFAKKGSIQERIDKAVAAQRAAERERDALKARYEAQLTPEPDPMDGRGDKVPGNISYTQYAEALSKDDGPQLDQFESYELWVDARAEWKANITWQRIQAEQREQHALYSHTERIQSFAAKTPDYFDTIAAAARLPVAKVMEAAIIQSDRGPELAYFLATHPEEAIRLAQEHVKRPLSDAPFVRELLESKLTSQAASSGPASGVSRSPVFRPIKPVGATPVTAETSPDDLEFGPEYVRRMNERDRKRGRV